MVPKHSSIFDEPTRKRLVVLLLASLTVFASLPVFSQIGADPGHDLTFHLYRILGIAEGLGDGQFPVRMQYSQLNGMGYPVSIYYGDIFLYYPALLVLAGLSVTQAYKVFVLTLNAAVIVSTYVFARRFSGSRSVSIAVTSVWALGTYRLIDLYLRGAVGEYTALAFFPLLAYALWCSFTSRGRSTTSVPPFILLAVAMTGIVLSHVISVLLAAIGLLGIFVGLLVVGDRRIYGIASVCAAFVTTLLLCAYFLVPFFEEYLAGNVRLLGEGEAIEFARSSTSTLGQLLMLFPEVRGGDLASSLGVAGEMPQAVGGGAVALVLVYLASLVVAPPRRFAELSGEASQDGPDARGIALYVRQVPWGVLAAFLVVLALCCCSFVWNDAIPFMSLLAVIQFPWRMLGPLLFLACLLGAIALVRLNALGLRELTLVLAVGITLFTVVEGGATMTSAMDNVPVQEPISAHDANGQHVAASIVKGEYLPAASDYQEVVELAGQLLEDRYVGEGFVLTSSASNGRVFTVSFDGSASQAKLPVLYYEGYEIVSGPSSATLSESEGGLVSIGVDQGYSGDVQIKYLIPSAWTISDYVSLISTALLVVYVLYACLAKRAPLRLGGE